MILEVPPLVHQQAKPDLDLALKHRVGHRNRDYNVLFLNCSSAVEHGNGGHWRFLYYTALQFAYICTEVQLPDAAKALSGPYPVHLTCGFNGRELGAAVTTGTGGLVDHTCTSNIPIARPYVVDDQTK